MSSFLAREIIKKLQKDTKVICVDFTGEYIKELVSLKPVHLIDSSKLPELEKHIADKETEANKGKYTDKAKLLEEFWRVLKPKGRAFVEIDSYKENYPDFMQINKETPRFVIYNKNKLIKLSAHLKKFQNKGFNIRLKRKKNGTAGYILMEKNTTKPLNLDLHYEDNLSFDLTVFYKEKKIDGVWWGTRSIFKVK